MYNFSKKTITATLCFISIFLVFIRFSFAHQNTDQSPLAECTKGLENITTPGPISYRDSQINFIKKVLRFYRQTGELPHERINSLRDTSPELFNNKDFLKNLHSLSQGFGRQIRTIQGRKTFESILQSQIGDGCSHQECLSLINLMRNQLGLNSDKVRFIENASINRTPVLLTFEDGTQGVYYITDLIVTSRLAKQTLHAVSLDSCKQDSFEISGIKQVENANNVTPLPQDSKAFEISKNVDLSSSKISPSKLTFQLAQKIIEFYQITGQLPHLQIKKLPDLLRDKNIFIKLKNLSVSFINTTRDLTGRLRLRSAIANLLEKASSNYISLNELLSLYDKRFSLNEPLMQTIINLKNQSKEVLTTLESGKKISGNILDITYQRNRLYLIILTKEALKPLKIPLTQISSVSEIPSRLEASVKEITHEDEQVSTTVRPQENIIETTDVKTGNFQAENTSHNNSTILIPVPRGLVRNYGLPPTILWTNNTSMHVQNKFDPSIQFSKDRTTIQWHNLARDTKTTTKLLGINENNLIESLKNSIGKSEWRYIDDKSVYDSSAFEVSLNIAGSIHNIKFVISNVDGRFKRGEVITIVPLSGRRILILPAKRTHSGELLSLYAWTRKFTNINSN